LQSAVTLHRVAAFVSPRSPLFEIANVLVHVDHIARFVVNANHRIVRQFVFRLECLAFSEWTFGQIGAGT
jgi:hypothetical protein